MKPSTCNRLGAGLLVLGLALTMPAYAQMGGGMGGGGMMGGSRVWAGRARSRCPARCTTCPAR